MSHLKNEELSQLFRESAEHLSRVVVWSGGEIVDDTQAGSGNILLISERSEITYDRNSSARGQARLAFWALDSGSKNILQPVSRPKLVVMTGVEAVGETVWKELGAFFPVEVENTESENGFLVELACSDPSEMIRNNNWSAPFKTGGGTYKQAIQAIITDRDSMGVAAHQLWLHEYTTENAPDLHYSEDDDPWNAIMDLAKSGESEAYFDQSAFFVHQKVPDPATQEVSHVLGSDDFKIEIGQRSNSSSLREVYNGVICRGEAPWLLFPVSGEYWDDDPASPTNRTDFGQKPKIIGDPVATTDAQCDAIAQAEFHKIAGVTEEVTFNALKDPTVNVGDLIRVEGSTLASSGTAPNVYTLETLRYPLGSQAMTGTVRRRSV